ncbi:MAG: glycosyltransferase [Syntrophobacteraceae bacterium]
MFDRLLKEKRGQAARIAKTSRRKRFLVASYDLFPAGGLLRFERFGREITKHGRQMAYLCMSGRPSPDFASEFEVLSLADALKRFWDITMVPGAGFPTEMIRKLERLVDDRFGLRVQHILNDQSRLDKFLDVNRHFKPDMIVFNNRHWPPGSFTQFQAKKFAFLDGAVDLTQFAPDPERKFPGTGERKIIGGLAAKNALPLIDALRMLSEDYELRLFGRVPDGLEQECVDLLSSGRLKFFGLIQDRELPRFYAEIDCVVHTEKRAGWANLAAEALACGIPLICTKNGTLAFAEHLETAMVLDDPTPEAISNAVQLLFNDRALTLRLVENGRRRISPYSWQNYARELLELCKPDSNAYYTFAPDLGLHGKWPLSERFEGLDIIFENCSGMTALDLGAAEGVISLECLKRGTSLIHSFELDPSRIRIARRLCVEFPNSEFRQANLSNWREFSQEHFDLLLDSYDIVLYLGIHHHLPKPDRLTTLTEAARRARKLFAIRTTDAAYQEDEIDRVLDDQGLIQISMSLKDSGNSGRCRIFMPRKCG